MNGYIQIVVCITSTLLAITIPQIATMNCSAYTRCQWCLADPDCIGVTGSAFRCIEHSGPEDIHEHEVEILVGDCCPDSKEFDPLLCGVNRTTTDVDDNSFDGSMEFKFAIHTWIWLVGSGLALLCIILATAGVIDCIIRRRNARQFHVYAELDFPTHLTQGNTQDVLLHGEGNSGETLQEQFELHSLTVYDGSAHCSIVDDGEPRTNDADPGPNVLIQEQEHRLPPQNVDQEPLISDNEVESDTPAVMNDTGKLELDSHSSMCGTQPGLCEDTNGISNSVVALARPTLLAPIKPKRSFTSRTDWFSPTDEIKDGAIMYEPRCATVDHGQQLHEVAEQLPLPPRHREGVPFIDENTEKSLVDKKKDKELRWMQVIREANAKK